VSAPVTGPPGRRTSRGHAVVSISAAVDYGLRVLCTLAGSDRPLTAHQLATAQGLPRKYLEGVLNELRVAGVVTSARGPGGGYRLARPADEITLLEAMTPLVGTLAEVRGQLPEAVTYDGPATHLRSVWEELRADLRAGLGKVTIDDVVSGRTSGGDRSRQAIPK
jgi:Rrf2 family protein